jgi:hypothetical protein
MFNYKNMKEEELFRVKNYTTLFKIIFDFKIRSSDRDL